MHEFLDAVALPLFPSFPFFAICKNKKGVGEEWKNYWGWVKLAGKKDKIQAAPHQ